MAILPYPFSYWAEYYHQFVHMCLDKIYLSSQLDCLDIVEMNDNGLWNLVTLGTAMEQSWYQ